MVVKHKPEPIHLGCLVIMGFGKALLEISKTCRVREDLGSATDKIKSGYFSHCINEINNRTRWYIVNKKVIENPVHSGNSTQLLAVICMQLEGC